MNTKRYVWCLSCNQKKMLKPEGTRIMKTAYKLTDVGPLPYGQCAECLRLRTLKETKTNSVYSVLRPSS